MAGGEEATLVDSRNTKLDAITNALEALRVKTETLSKHNEELYTTVHSSQRTAMPELPQQIMLGTPTTQATIASPDEMGTTLAPKEPRISLPEKFDGTRSKFRGFVNQVRLITLLQPQRYSTEASRVGLV